MRMKSAKKKEKAIVNGSVVQQRRIRACHARGRGSKAHRSRQPASCHHGTRKIKNVGAELVGMARDELKPSGVCRASIDPLQIARVKHRSAI